MRDCFVERSQIEVCDPTVTGAEMPAQPVRKAVVGRPPILKEEDGFRSMVQAVAENYFALYRLSSLTELICDLICDCLKNNLIVQR